MNDSKANEAAAEPPLDCRVGRRVVCSATRERTGKMRVICSVRHWDALMRKQAEDCEFKHWDAEQGFVDQHGEFLTREDAWMIAEAAGQIIRRVGGDGQRLYSENLY